MERPQRIQEDREAEVGRESLQTDTGLTLVKGDRKRKKSLKWQHN